MGKLAGDQKVVSLNPASRREVKGSECKQCTVTVAELLRRED